VANKDVKLFPAAERVLLELVTAERWKGSKIAVASRTNKGPWAKSLLKQFKVGGQTLDELITYQEIYSSDKTRHFEALKKRSGIKFEDMLFFDDAKDGPYGNCQPVARLGVMSAHCPSGLTSEIWTNSLQQFAAAKAAGGGVRMGKVLDAPGGMDAPGLRIDCFSMNQPFAGLVAHGFKRLETRNSTVFQKLAGKWVCLHVGQVCACSHISNALATH
jgi:magnesium-dependent phosphatase 1